MGHFRTAGPLQEQGEAWLVDRAGLLHDMVACSVQVLATAAPDGIAMIAALSISCGSLGGQDVDCMALVQHVVCSLASTL